MNVAGKYVLFAALATAVNLLTQAACLAILTFEDALVIAIGAGTFTGLVLKYVLDKKFIFYYEAGSAGADVQKFSLYAAVGVLTTLLFWGTELAFDALWPVPAAKYVGGLVGLSGGYLAKYHLDKRFVFRTYAADR